VTDDLDTLLATDFAPFAALADMPIAMTAHIVFSAIDPARPATASPVVIRDIIRGRISFGGLLLSDDISMHALSGDFRERAASAYAAGCDLVLHCNGRTEEMRAVADAAPALAGFSGERAARALEMRREPTLFDREEARRDYRALFARVDWPVVS
jgi:beta-N-acetylhexosaminidase